MFKNTKTYMLILKLLVLFICLILISNFLNNQKFLQNKNIQKKDNLIKNTNNNYLTQRNSAIKKYLLSKEGLSWKTDENSNRICVFKQLDNNELFPISIWAYCVEYTKNKEDVIINSGLSLPLIIDYPNELSFFDLQRMTHQSPRDGSFYSEDIKNMFSKEAQNKIFNKNFEKEMKSLIINEVNKQN